jgi:hypothetical protein
LSIRNLNTNVAFTFYQADVGSLPDAAIDIWGLSNLHILAGETGVTSVYPVQYYHKRFFRPTYTLDKKIELQKATWSG